MFNGFQILRNESPDENSGVSDLFTDSANPNVFIVLLCNLIAGSILLCRPVPLRFRFRFFNQTDCLGAPALFTRACLCGCYSSAFGKTKKHRPCGLSASKKKKRNHCRDFLGYPDETPVLISVRMSSPDASWNKKSYNY